MKQGKPAPGIDLRTGEPKKGKRSNPEYGQVTAWIRKDTYRKVTDRLFNREDRAEFSDLVQILLEEWLRRR